MGEGPVRITVRVQPGAGRNEVRGWEDGVLQVRVTAPPAEGQANAAVAALLARRLGLGKRSVRVERGLRGRIKTVLVEGLTAQRVRELLPGGPGDVGLEGPPGRR